MRLAKKEEILHYVSLSKLDKAINIVISLAKEKGDIALIRNAILLSMRIYYLKDAIQTGRIDWEEEIKLLASIGHGILNLIEAIDDDLV